MKVTLEINDNKAKAFLEFIKSLDFVQVKDETDGVPTKAEVLQGIRNAQEEVKLHSEGKIELQSARDFLNEL